MRTLLLALALTAPVLAGAARDVRFERTVIDRRFISEGIAVADVNRDGRLDIIAGNLWYEAPQWTPHEIAPVVEYNGAAGYSNSFFCWSADVNHDGWVDQVMIPIPGDPAVWRENPGRKGGPWKEHLISPNACNESPAFADLLGDRKPVLVFPVDGVMSWFEPAADPTQPFVRHAVGVKDQPGTQRFSHGLGVGDMDGDGRADIVTTGGWYRAPADRRTGPWTFVKADLRPDCAQMLVMDVNGDGLADVITSSAHLKGVWWHEQRRGVNGPEFVKHEIDSSISETHAMMLADFNGDGRMDFMTGKRFWAHGPHGDVDADAPAMVVWYELQRKGHEVIWVRHDVDANSGVGTQCLVCDINRDRLPDIVVANKKGVHLFTQVRPGRAR